MLGGWEDETCVSPEELDADGDGTLVLDSRRQKREHGLLALAAAELLGKQVHALRVLETPRQLQPALHRKRALNHSSLYVLAVACDVNLPLLQSRVLPSWKRKTIAPRTPAVSN